MLVTIMIVSGFFLVAAGPAPTPTPEQQRATLQAEIKELSQQYETEQLKKENATLRMERIAKRAGEIQAELKKLEPKKDEKEGKK